jgi:hypothetical protein
VTPERLAEIREQAEKLREYRLMVVDLLDSRDALAAALRVIANHETGNIDRTARAALRDAGEPE